MSTRANIVLKAKGEKPLWFYRHSDGYPSGAMPLLEKFMDHVKAGRIRANIGQAAGWLVVFGHQQYRPTPGGNANNYEPPQFEPGEKDSISAWKVGAIEPTSWGLHGDVKYLYTLDLDAKTIKCEHVGRDYGTPRNYDKEPTVTFVAIDLVKELLT